MRDYDPGDPEEPDGGGPGEEPDDEDEPLYLSGDEEFDDLTMESLFLPVTSLWQVLGAIDDNERLTALGWWACPRPCSGSGPRPAARWTRFQAADSRPRGRRSCITVLNTRSPSLNALTVTRQ